MKLKINKGQTGITLIALVVTIIVLLILAGISINMLMGQNGILNRAVEAKEKTASAQQEEHNILNEYEEKISNYAGIDWEFSKMNAKAPEEQKEERNNGVIGIGTDGKPVNMDLWEYTKMDNGTYGLNTLNGLDSSGESGRNTGYKGDFTDEGKIQGKIPVYISIDNGKKWNKVTSLVHTFYNCSDLKIAPKIPEYITDMSVTFYKCNNLIEAPDIPLSVTKLSYTFAMCTNLENMPQIGNNVKNFNGAFQTCSSLKNTTQLPDCIEEMDGSFYKCISLTKAPEIPLNTISLRNTFQGCIALRDAPSLIPEGVENMQSTFQDCNELNNIPMSIPSSVKNMRYTFANCTNVRGSIKINAKPDSYDNCFLNCANRKGCHLVLGGLSPILEELLGTKSSDSNIEIANF